MTGWEKHLQSYIRHLVWDQVCPVPTWNLRHRGATRYKRQAMRLPEELSASRGVGGLPAGHDGRSDPSQVVEVAELSRRSWRSGRHREALALGLSFKSRPLIEGGVVAQRGVADARELVGKRTGGLVVVGARLDLKCPLAHTAQDLALLESKELTAMLKGRELLPRRTLLVLDMAANTLDNEAPYAKQPARVTAMADAIRMTLGLVLRGEAHEDRKLGVPRIV